MVEVVVAMKIVVVEVDGIVGVVVIFDGGLVFVVGMWVGDYFG